MAAFWSVDFHPACEAWAEGLEQPDGEALLAAIRVLEDVGGTRATTWTGWYEVNLPIADDRFDEHQAGLEAKRASAKRVGTRQARSSKGKGRR